MSENEDFLDHFPVRDSISPAEYMVGEYRAEHTKDWSVISGILPKFHIRWWDNFRFNYSSRYEQTKSRVEEQDSWKCWEAQRTPHRDALKAEDGVKYFWDKLRPHFVKGT